MRNQPRRTQLGFNRRIISGFETKEQYDASSLAQFFHNTYERLAPKFGYETRPDTKSFNTSSPNGKLMIAVCEAVLTHPLVSTDHTIPSDEEELLQECEAILQNVANSRKGSIGSLDNVYLPQVNRRKCDALLTRLRDHMKRGE